MSCTITASACFGNIIKRRGQCRELIVRNERVQRYKHLHPALVALRNGFIKACFGKVFRIAPRVEALRPKVHRVRARAQGCL